MFEFPTVRMLVVWGLVGRVMQHRERERERETERERERERGHNLLARKTTNSSAAKRIEGHFADHPQQCQLEFCAVLK